MKINQYIEQTILKADTSIDDIKNLCQEAIQNQFIGVCVPPYFVKIAKQELKDDTTKIVTVVGFPLGYSTTPSKVEEARKAINEGADEIDMVINIAALKAKKYTDVRNDILSVTTLTQLMSRKLKVIIETALLTQEEKLKACEICAAIQVDFVKTSTGFSTAGAKVEDIELMRANLPSSIKIKASGGIKNHQQAIALIEAGADRLGTSSGVDLLQ